MKRARWIVGGVALIGVAVAAQTVRQGDNTSTAANAAPAVRADELSGGPALEPNVAPKARGTTQATPMAERVAVLGLLNKRNGLSRDLTLKPGQGVRIGDLVVRVRACDQTEPWEADQLTGAFVQVIVQAGPDRWRKVFSGWLFKETPSLNVVEHPVYDVWTKACMMRHPEVGPDTLAAPPLGRTSSAKKSAGAADNT